MKFNRDNFYLGDSVKKNVLVSSDHGMMIVNRFDYNDKATGQGIWLLDHGNVSTIESQITFDLINIPNPIIIDVGANIGTYATWVAKAYPAGKIICFEPQRAVFQILCGNMALNNIENVYAFNYALGKENNVIKFNEPDYSKSNNYGSFSLLKNEIDITELKHQVDCYSLDNFLKKYNIDKIDFLKIDCEGMDFDVLYGAKNIIQHCKPKILIEYKTDWCDLQDEILSFLTPFKYEYFMQERNIIAR